MHHALFVSDIVSLILDCFFLDGALADEQGGPYIVDCPTLASCARTCQAFHTPAIKGLWKYHDLDLETVLLHCMPTDVWEIRRETSPTNSAAVVDYMILKRPVTPEDMSRLLVIAPLINMLTVGEHRSIMLAQESYSFISSFLPKGVSSAIQYLHLDYRSTKPESLHPLITPTLAVHSPHISDFEVHLPYDDGDGVGSSARREVSDVLRTWSLRRLRAEGRDYNLLADLSQSSTIKHLDLKFRDDSLKPQSVDFHPMSFAALQDLCLDNVDMRVAIALLKKSNFDTLYELCLDPVHTVSRDWPELYRTINSAIIRPESMMTLVIEPSDMSLDHLHESSGPMTNKDLIPFFQFRNLTTLALRHPGGFDVGSSTIECLAEALPHLTTFALSSMKQPRCQPRAGLHVLESLAMHCPELRSVGLTLDARGTSFRSPPPSYKGTEIQFDFGRDGHEGEVEEDDESSLDEEDVESSDDESD
ncbi:uncharacterized protein SCHCODRAFT_02713256 [Schizophyllum commune H4-8]|nr:uncharacterized protein SCHCODRAFT_02713256 [Schizophyllum commune H4-8]KAI5887452.1 hypothetical protein SCHCODRAFT_02713256 [Schizophyllum commune H4-8]